MAVKSKQSGTRKRDILFTIGSLEIGGAEVQMTMLAEELAARGWSVRVFSLGGVGPLKARLEAAGVVTIDGAYRPPYHGRLLTALALVNSSRRLLVEILKRRPTILHGFLPLTNVMAAVVGRMALVPTVVTSKRSLGHYQERVPAFKVLDRVANFLSDRITANASEIAMDTERRDGYPASRIVVIPNGLDFSRFAQADEVRLITRGRMNLHEEEIAIIKVANLIPYKGHSELIEAFASLVRDGLTARLFLVGEDRGTGPSLYSKVREAGIEDKVHFLGRRDDVPELLCAMDVGVMSSHEEGLPNALIEKAAAGLPLIATDVGGANQILRDLPNCRLVPPKRSDELAKAIREVVQGRSTGGHEVESRRRITIQRYSVGTMVDAYEWLYLSCESPMVDPSILQP